MKNPLVMHPEAAAELHAAVEFYESRSPGLGLRFLREVERVLDAIRETPARHAVLRGGVRRALLRVFPYAVLYAESADRQVVLAVMHLHRAPGYWRARR